jgi:hypothetical protein
MNPMVLAFMTAHEGGELKFQMLLVLMKKLSLNCTWKTCGKKEWLGNCIIAIHLLGYFLR